jgi:uncharacterized membrane protein
MASITVLKFENADGAQSAVETVAGLNRDHLIQLHDAAIVSWPKGKKKPKTRQLTDMTGAGALNGAFWGMLFGMIFFMPFLGAAIGAATGALSGSLANVGIHDGFIEKIRASVTEGTSCLFLMTSDAVEDKVVEAMSQYTFEILDTNLTEEQEKHLRHAFGEEA